MSAANLCGLPRNSNIFRFLKYVSGYGIKFFAFYVFWIQEKGRIVRWVYFELRGYDTGSPAYNLFLGRSELIEPEQPHSVYFLNKFVQPTHLYMHSNMWDYPETARKENITSNEDWEHTVVVYEPFRTPHFAPKYIKEQYDSGKFNLTVPREEFKGTDEEYFQNKPGHIIENWHTEQLITKLLWLCDEFETPDAKLP